jgi:hypothetical protein
MTDIIDSFKRINLSPTGREWLIVRRYRPDWHWATPADGGPLLTIEEFRSFLSWRNGYPPSVMIGVSAPHDYRHDRALQKLGYAYQGSHRHGTSYRRLYALIVVPFYGGFLPPATGICCISSPRELAPATLALS